MREEIVSKEN